MSFDPTAVPDLVAAWRTQNRALVDLVRAADLGTPVPTCPGWTLRQLVTHVGRGDRWAATMVAQRAETAVDPRSVADGKPPAGGVEAWLAAGVDLLAAAVAEVGADSPVWTFTGPHPSAWWLRRRLHEALVHRADAALAVGAAFEVPAAVAADAVSEWLTLVAARPAGEEPPLPDGATMHLHATDGADARPADAPHGADARSADAPHGADARSADAPHGDLGAAGEWMVRSAGNAVTWEPGHAKGSVAVRGPAADLLLVLYRRLPTDRVEVLGDAAVLETWLARTGF
jgi:uncharacterized protein (TIGR03083 family)